jgi:Salmonella virulence plasmid 65kDa B protein
MNIYILPRKLISLFRITVVLTVFAITFGPVGMAYAQVEGVPASTPPAGDTSTPDTSGTTPASSDTSAPAAGGSSSVTDTSTPGSSPATPLGQSNQSSDSTAGTAQGTTPGNSDGTKGKSSTTGSNGSKSGQTLQPMTSGGVTNTGTPSSVPFASADPRPSIHNNTGSLTYGYPFTLPKGIDGLPPELSLNYDNNKREEGSLVGFGWTLSIPKVYRLNKTGTDNLYTGNFFASSLDDELVQIGTSSATTTYAARFDDGSFRRYQRNSSYWVMTTKEGLTYTFGQLDEAREGPDANTISTWYVSSIVDTHGNTISFHYTKTSGVVYPYKIDYAQEGGSQGYEVRFTLENRTDPISSYRYAFAQAIQQRISQVGVYFGPTLRQQYTLSYTSGVNGARSLLTSVTVTGYDDNGSPTTCRRQHILITDRSPGRREHSQPSSPRISHRPIRCLCIRLGISTAMGSTRYQVTMRNQAMHRQVPRVVRKPSLKTALRRG